MPTRKLTPDFEDSFEDHCWKDIMPPDVIELYSNYRREVGVGPSPALIAIDLYELVYQGGAKPVPEVMKTYPNSCGEYAWAAIAPTKRLFRRGARGGPAGLLFDRRHAAAQPAEERARDPAPGRAHRSRDVRDPPRVRASSRGRGDHQGQGERVLRHAARRAPDAARREERHRVRREHLGCVRASAVDAYSTVFT